MANEIHEIPISPGSLFRADRGAPVRGGHSRFVPMVPVSQDVSLPCIWRSHAVTQGLDNSNRPIRVHECLLLISRDPIVTMRAEVEVDAWQNFGEALVEW